MPGCSRRRDTLQVPAEYFVLAVFKQVVACSSLAVLSMMAVLMQGAVYPYGVGVRYSGLLQQSSIHSFYI